MREKEAERRRKSGQVYVSKWKWFESLKFLDSGEENSPTKGFDFMQKESALNRCQRNRYKS